MARRPGIISNGRAAGGFAVRMLLAAAAVAAALAAALCASEQAWALGDDENLVNPQQRPDSSFIYDTPISALNSADTYYDNQTVQIVGEATGDAISVDLDGSHRWVSISAEEQGVVNSISVYMTETQASRIDEFGRYGTVGTTLQVRGTFHLVCAEHDGVTDIHAEVVSVVDQSSHHPDVFKPMSFVPGIVMVAVGFALMGVFYFLRERQR